MQHVTDRRVEPTAPRADAASLRGAAHVDLAIADMGCPACGHRIRNELLSRPGVVEVEVDVPASLARVWFDPQRVSVAQIVAVVAEAGEGTQHRYLAVPVGHR